MSNNITLAIGSKNPVKVKSSLNGISASLKAKSSDFNDTISTHSYDVPSQVSDQPMSDAETKLGAINRSKAAYSRHLIEQPSSITTYAVGLEGGCQLIEDSLECFAWIAIYDGKRLGVARTASFALPPRIRDLVLSGMELGDADDAVFGSVNSKQAGGTVGHLTNGLIDRSAYYEQAVSLAMIPFLWLDLYTDEQVSSK